MFVSPFTHIPTMKSIYNVCMHCNIPFKTRNYFEIPIFSILEYVRCQNAKRIALFTKQHFIPITILPVCPSKAQKLPITWYVDIKTIYTTGLGASGVYCFLLKDSWDATILDNLFDTLYVLLPIKIIFTKWVILCVIFRRSINIRYRSYVSQVLC